MGNSFRYLVILMPMQKSNRASCWRKCIVLAGLGLITLLSTNSTSAQASKKHRQFITVKLINGKTGRSIWNGIPYVFVGKSMTETIDPYHSDARHRTDFFGETRVEVTDANPAALKVWVDYITQDCRYPSADAPPLAFTYDGKTMKDELTYSIDEIEKTGLVSANYCGAPRTKAKPGVLVIYVIQETFKELWNN
jgi:hypothetical protein